MSKLAAALAWAARGFPVFPLVPDGKEPAFDGSWFDQSTTDPDMIRAYWTDPVLRTERDYNIGVDCTGHVVADIDVKEGKDGYNQYVQLGGTFDTLVVRTPTGGLHCYFEGPDSANVNIARDIEIRSYHGYVVAPGSTINGVPYVIEKDMTPQWVPLSIDKLLNPVHVRKEYAHAAELDNPASVNGAINFLQTTPIAIEGQRGDETTYITAARLVREFGLSVFTAFELMRDHWNERCLPPWQLDELLGKVENAANYGTAGIGRLDPAVAFGGFSVEPPPPLFAAPSIAWGNASEASSLKPRPWLIDRLLMTGHVSMIAGAGSAGKSTVALALAAHGALGLDFAGLKTRRPFKTVIYNGEDDHDEMSRRLYAVCNAYGFDYAYIKSRVLILTYEDVDMTLVSVSGYNASANTTIINGFMELFNDPEIGLAILDPFVDLHTGDESNPAHMNVVMSVTRDIAKRANIAMMLMHHVTKAGSARQEERIGNMDIFRGSSGIVFKCRAAFTLMDASEQDAEDYGLQDHERHMWARLDDAKMNMSLRSGKATWFKRIGVTIPSGDVVGVLHHEELTKSVNHLRGRMAEVILQTLLSTNTSTMSITQTVAVLREGEPLLANKKDAEIKQRVETAFISPVQIRQYTLQLRREPVKNQQGDKVYMVLT